MQNERLFKRIKDIAQRDTSGTGDYRPEKIWADIKRKQERKEAWRWRPYAAASVLLLAGVFGLVFQTAETGLRDSRNGLQGTENSIRVPELPVPEDSGTSLPVQRGDEAYAPGIAARHRKVGPGLPEPGQAPAPEPAVSPPTEESPPGHPMAADTDPAGLMHEALPPEEPRPEKVLVAYISLPDDLPADTPLRSFVRTAKKGEPGKKRQFGQIAAKPGLWSFVRHSFVERPPLNPPFLPEPARDTTH